MSDVFISYSRLDKDFVGKLRESLAVQEQEVWIDWESIPPSQAWWSEIQKGIAKANNFVVVLSPNSMSSPICHIEIEYARRLGKRIIPVLHQDYKRDEAISSIAARLANPEQETTRQLWGMRQPQDVLDANDSELKHINYFFFKSEDNFQTRFDELFKVIRTDYRHKEQHTTLELRAQEWDRRGRDASFLLLDTELAQAQAWLQSATDKEPAPTPLQREYIQASHKRTRQLRNIRRMSIIGSMVAAIAILFAIVASFIGVRATNDVNVASTQVAGVQPTLNAANRQIDNANATLTPISVTLTQAAVIRQDALDKQTITEGFASALIIRDDAPDESVARMDALIDEYPEHASVFFYRGVFYVDLGDYEQAIGELEKAIELDPSDALSYRYRGGLYLDIGEYEQAIADFDHAIELNSSNAISYRNRGTTYLFLGQHEQAIADFDHAIQLNSSDAISYRNRANAYQFLGQYEQSIADYDQAIELDPSDAISYRNRGTAYQFLGQYEQSIADYDQAIELDPSDAISYRNRGTAHYFLGNYSTSLGDWTVAETLGLQLSQFIQEARTAILEQITPTPRN